MTLTIKNKLSDLHSDERGAMMLISVFMALIAVAMLYYVAAIGETVVYRERLQDGADGAAYMGAAVMARSMNIVVIMNLAIASIFASAVITNLVIWIIVGAEAAASAACAGWCGSCCLAAFCLAGDICEAMDDHDAMVDEVQDATRLADAVQDELMNRARIAGVAASIEIALGYGDPVNFGGSFGQNLPIQDDTDRRRMCDKTLGNFGQSAAIAGIALYQAQTMACSRGRPYVVAGLLASIGLRWICNSAHGDVRPRAARLTADLGEREFQFFGGVAGGEPPIDDNDERVGVARWSTSGSTIVDDLGLRNVARVAVAQSEYYHGSRESRQEQPWSVQWRARLRRFNVTQAGGGVCSAVGDLCGTLGRAVVH